MTNDLISPILPISPLNAVVMTTSYKQTDPDVQC